jgi:hypothetical protein
MGHDLTRTPAMQAPENVEELLQDIEKYHGKMSMYMQEQMGHVDLIC